jgi:aspartate oxidase
LRNSAQVALIIAMAAHGNRISRGCHYREDSRRWEKTITPPDDHLVKLVGGL